MQKRFVTIFPDAENVHLIKDVGQVPFWLKSRFGWDSLIACHHAVGGYPYLDTETPGLVMAFLRRSGHFLGLNIAVLIYILRNAKEIGVLNLFHYNRANAIYAWLYKRINGCGIVYVKLDLGIQRLDINGGLLNRGSGIRGAFVCWYEKLFIDEVDIFSVETNESLNRLCSLYPKISDRFLLIRNGTSFLPSGNIQKDNRKPSILYVGRVGSPEKNTELFLEALAKVNLVDWHVNVVGPIEDGFEKKVTDFFSQNPNLRERVTFVGPVFDRQRLADYYAKSQIFCLTSHWEGFALVFAEALVFGNYIVSTDVSGAKEALKDGNGVVVPQGSIDGYVNALSAAMKCGMSGAISFDGISKRASLIYGWKSILEPLNERLRKK